MPYTISFSYDPALDGFMQESIAPQCAWAANPDDMEEYATRLVRFVLEQEQVEGDIEVSLSLVTRQQIHELNAEYRGIDRPTDVLSFPCDSPDEVEPGQLVELGDVVISPEVCFEQSADYGNTYVQEFSLLLTHGVLHLLGYDHIEDADAEVMEPRERELRAAWEEACQR